MSGLGKERAAKEKNAVVFFSVFSNNFKLINQPFMFLFSNHPYKIVTLNNLKIGGKK